MKKIVLILFILLLSITSCDNDQDNHCFQSYGKKVKEIRELPAFNTISVHDIFNVFLIQDTINQIVVETGANIIDDIITEVTERRLRISNESKCRFLRKYDRVNLYISVSHLNYVWLWQPCKVITVNSMKRPYLRIYSYAKLFEGELDVDCGEFDFGVNFACSGICHIKGYTEKLKLMNRGMFHIFADQMECSNAYIVNNSIGDIYLNDSDSLFVDIWLRGNIYYTGSPVIIINEIRSTGQLIKNE